MRRSWREENVAEVIAVIKNRARSRAGARGIDARARRVREMRAVAACTGKIES